MPTRDQLLGASQSLHNHLLRRHYSHGMLHGPDPGMRFNLRAWRFLKSALDFVPWRDDYLFMQSQGYWALANWMLYDLTGEQQYRQLAIETSEATLRLQTLDGYWAYPLPDRKHLIAALEVVWGAIALIATYEREGRKNFLEGAIRSYDFLINRIGFQEHTQGKAINYFDQPRGRVPNNSVAAAWFFLQFWKVTGERRFLEHVEALLEFVASTQHPSGELPYIVASPYEKARRHYLCFQYNAFQFLELAWSARLKPGTAADAVLPSLARFLSKGVTSSGASAWDCFRSRPELDYYTAVLAAAFYEAARMNLAATSDLSQRCYARVLARQKLDGCFGFSAGDYGFLGDTRSYPRQQVMTLFHLLRGCRAGEGF